MTKFLISQKQQDYYDAVADIQIEQAVALAEYEDAWIEYLQGDYIEECAEMLEALAEQEQADLDAFQDRIERLDESTAVPSYTPIIRKDISVKTNTDETNTVKTLCFGMNIGSTGKVSKQDWEEFKTTEITPRFPGFTEREVKGHWEGKAEDSIELVIACPNNADNERKLKEIRQAYCKRFQQDSVMKTNSDNTVEF